ncbi:MAG: fasciclin domain-containing protein [Chitinophagaceae bacterium]|nr:fasciclin domain-containing protein [Chitinophagaceae bacterium]
MSTPVSIRQIRQLAGPVILLFCGFLGACHKTMSDPENVVAGRTVLQTLGASFDVSLFNEALSHTGLADSLNGPGPYTLFAPNDAAFDSMGIHTKAQIDSMDKTTLTNLLKYHILYGRKVTVAQVDQKPNNPFTDWAGLSLYLSRPYNIVVDQGIGYDNTNLLTVNGDTVFQKDIIATNGVIHTLQRVLQYQTYTTCADLLSADTSYSYFVTALKEFGLFDQLSGPGPITVCAPVNGAFRNAGISLDSVKSLDTAHFNKLLFKPYLMPSLRFFSSDLHDFGTGFSYYPPDNSYNLTIYYQALGNSFFSKTMIAPYIVMISAIGLDPATHVPVNLVNPYGSTLYAPFIREDYPAGNGVVHTINQLMALPSYCKFQN